MITFGAPSWLWALSVIPALVFLFVFAERRSAARLGQFVAPRLLPQLGATVNRFRRGLRFALALLGVGLAIAALAQPRFGYTYEEVKRKGLDLIVVVDTSRSMLANDVPPNRLQRVKLAAQDLIGALRGDRVGLIAFAGRAFLQAPLTIDYDAAVETLNDLDTTVIPEGGSNISEAINLSVQTFGKSAIGNRALIIFTDGEELSGDAVKAAKEANDAGVRIFTVGVGTPEGSLIPLVGQSGGTSFVKDGSGQVVKSKLDEKRLREIAESTGGFFVPLGGPETMRKLYDEGLSKMQAAEIDAKMSQQRIERYQWPLGAALLALSASLLTNERKRVARAVPLRRKKNAALTAAALLLSVGTVRAATPGLDAYHNDEFAKAYQQFQQTLQEHPTTHATDKIQFDAGAAAYKMKDYGKALQSFSQALLSPDQGLQSRSHYNLGNTLYQRGEMQKPTEAKLTDWNNALQHYDEALKIGPENKEAQENRDFVRKKIEELKNQQQPTPTPTPSPTPSPSPSPSPKSQDKKDQKKDQQKDDKKDKDQKDSGDGEKDQQKSGENPTPSPTPDKAQTGSSPSPGQGSSPSPSPGEQGQPSPSPQEKSNGPSPSPSPGEDGESQNNEANSPTPAPSPSGSPEKKPSGEVKGAPEDQPKDKGDANAEAEPPPDGQMSEQQAEQLLQSMKDEEKRVQLDERRKVRRVYNDW